MTYLQQIADNNHVSVEEVEREIKKAMEEAMKSTDPKVQKFWAQYKSEGNPVHPEHFVRYLALAASDPAFQMKYMLK